MSHQKSVEQMEEEIAGLQAVMEQKDEVIDVQVRLPKELEQRINELAVQCGLSGAQMASAILVMSQSMMGTQEADAILNRNAQLESQLAALKAREQMEPVGGTVHKTICTEQGENYRLAYVDVNIPADVALYAQPPLSPDVAEAYKRGHEEAIEQVRHFKRIRDERDELERRLAEQQAQYVKLRNAFNSVWVVIPQSAHFAQQTMDKVNELLGRELDSTELTRRLSEARREEDPRLVSYAPDFSTCTLRNGSEEYYFNRVDAEARKSVPEDTARLDWLQNNEDGLYRVTQTKWVHRTDGSNTRDKVTEFLGWSCSLSQDECPTAREAIDKAMLSAAPNPNKEEV